MTSWPTLTQALILILLGAIASGVNAVAGGGSLISFPALNIGFHLHSVTANATNSVALWPGSLSGAFGFREHLSRSIRLFRLLFIPTFCGSLIGATLLLRSTHRLFSEIVPFLVMIAAFTVFLQPRVKEMVLGGKGRLHPVAAWMLQFVVSVYGGYFGAGMGIMMLGVFGLTIEGDIHELNAVKNWLGVIINLTCSTYFVLYHLVLLEWGLFLSIGAILGGFAAARISQRFNPERLRIAIGVYGILMGLFFFWDAFLR